MTHGITTSNKDMNMFTKKTRTPLMALLLSAITVGYAVAQENDVPNRGVAVESNTALPPALPAGTVISIFINDTITSRHNRVGDGITATIAQPVVDTDGEVAIPVGAVVLGVITDIAPEDEGRFVLTFYGVVFGGSTHSMQARIINLHTRKQRRGNTAGDAAKVGVGAVVGGIAGRLIGGNKKGTIIGALSGAAAGGGVAAATRKDDVVLDAGAPILLMLTAPLVL